jgi:hypothetical protein
MSTATVSATLDRDEVFVGVVTVASRTASCTCGWAGRRRAVVFLAVHDAWMHCAADGCWPGVPLVAGR